MASPAAPAAQPSPLRSARPAGRLGSDEFNSGALPTAQEAAVLYAANHVEAAAAILKAEVKDPVGRNNKQAWLMLFDLYQIQQNKQEFESLGMMYTVKFEQSPPVWAEGSAGESSDPRRATQSRERKDFFALKGEAGDLEGDIDKFLAFAQAQGTVRLDVSKVTGLSPGEALKLAATLVQLRKKKIPMWFNNVESLEKILRGTFNEKPADEQKSYWLLLFELLILQGKPEAFEDLGMEFAVAFEMSPPNWEVYVNSVAAEAAKAGAPKPIAASQPPEAGYALKGVLSPASSNQIAELNNYAGSRTEVAVDMGKVLRIEFPFTATFFDTVKAIQLAGKRVILTNLNELNAALLEAMGVNRYAILVRRR